jgi:hypothetical protein
MLATLDHDCEGMDRLTKDPDVAHALANSDLQSSFLQQGSTEEPTPEDRPPLVLAQAGRHTAGVPSDLHHRRDSTSLAHLQSYASRISEIDARLEVTPEPAKRKAHEIPDDTAASSFLVKRPPGAYAVPLIGDQDTIGSASSCDLYDFQQFSEEATLSENDSFGVCLSLELANALEQAKIVSTPVCPSSSSGTHESSVFCFNSPGMAFVSDTSVVNAVQREK